MSEMSGWDALDILYEAVNRLHGNNCDLVYIQGEVEKAYEQNEALKQLTGMSSK